ncbi:MAG: hypothetical protein FJW40_24395 [Acidobacteria bacterium]|nr:hypothetical protein [Acidobacteriota bacterium]
MDRRTFLASLAAAPLAAKRQHPNVVVILADDLGWADVGFHGSEYRTPNIDLLASRSLELERFYPGFPFSAPVRECTRDFHFGSPGPQQSTPTPHSRAGFDQNPLSEGGPVPADGFFRPSHKNEN